MAMHTSTYYNLIKLMLIYQDFVNFKVTKLVSKLTKTFASCYLIMWSEIVLAMFLSKLRECNTIDYKPHRTITREFSMNLQ